MTLIDVRGLEKSYGSNHVLKGIDLYSSFYADPRPTDELLERFGLLSHKAKRFDSLSGGQQQRLSVAPALVGRPRIAFLDELTTGLDPAARRDIWEYLKGLRDEGVTMLLVTHFMEEAQYLCDRVVVIDGGHVVAQGTPEGVAGGTGQQQTFFDVDPALDHAILRRVPSVTDVRTARGRTVVTGDADPPQAVIAALASAGVTVKHLRVESPSLDDAFLSLTHDRTQS